MSGITKAEIDDLPRELRCAPRCVGEDLPEGCICGAATRRRWYRAGAALRIALAKHRDELVKLDKSRKYVSDTLRRWIAEANEALAADDAAELASQAVAALNAAGVSGTGNPIDDLIARSSLGSPEVLAIRAQADPAIVDRVLARADELAAGTSGTGETKECPECTGRFACERCGVQVSGHNEPGMCDGGTDNEPRFMNSHDDAGTWLAVNGCSRCENSGRVPADESESK